MTQEQKIKEFVDKIMRLDVEKIGYSEGYKETIREEYTKDLTNLLDNWISVEDELPPKIVDDFVETMTEDYVVICEHPNNEKRQTALASYDYETKEWTDHWCSVIKEVTHWIEPPKLPLSR